MRTKLVPLVVVAALGFAQAALAATDVGTIESVNANDHTLMLTDGMRFVAPSAIDLSKFKAGEEVKIVWEQQENQNVISELTLSK